MAETAVPTANYGRELDFQGSGAECPPEDIYTFTIMDVSDPQNRASSFNEGDVDVQIVVSSRLDGYEYDEDDPDDYNWNGHQVKTFVKVGAIYAKNPDKVSAVWKSERSTAYPFFQAIFPEWDWSKDGLRNQALALDDMIGRKFRAALAPNQKGYPRLSNYTRAKANKPKKAAPPPPVDDDDPDGDLLSDD